MRLRCRSKATSECNGPIKRLDLKHTTFLWYGADYKRCYRQYDCCSDLYLTTT